MSIKRDFDVIREKDPAIKSWIEVFLYPGFWALFFHRGAHWLYKKRLFLIARIVSQFSRWITGIEIHPGATIGEGLFIDHGMGVVIGETCEIGNNVVIYQGVTLGGTGKEHGKRHPTIGNNVLIGSGVKVLGPFKVGDNAKIGAGSVVLNEIPPNCTAVGIPARAIKRGEDCNNYPSDCMDQVKLPDPVEMEICSLRCKVERLEKELSEITKKSNEKNFINQ